MRLRPRPLSRMAGSAVRCFCAPLWRLETVIVLLRVQRRLAQVVGMVLCVQRRLEVVRLYVQRRLQVVGMCQRRLDVVGMSQRRLQVVGSAARSPPKFLQ